MDQLFNIDSGSSKASLFGEGQFICSSLQEFYKETAASPLSIKLVLSGQENYKVNQKRYTVEKGNYLIVNKNTTLETSVASKKQVNGLCIYPPEALIQDAIHTNRLNESERLDHWNNIDHTHLFTEKLYHIKENTTGAFLERYIPQFLEHHHLGKRLPMDDFYMGLAQVMANSQLKINHQLKNLEVSNKQTEEELFRRVSIIREYIRFNYSQSISLDEMAQEACLSKYHFMRSFKKIYGISPYQYLLECRLNKAHSLVLQEYSYKEIMLATGFSDIKNLKKALKKNGLQK